VPTPADLFLSPDLTEDDARAYLSSLGFRDATAVDKHLQAMAEDLAVREVLGRIAGDLLPALLESPDPDAAVAGVSQYLAARTGRATFLDYIGEDPRAMHVLMCVFGSSSFLSEILIRHPEYFHWLVAQVERSAPDRQDLEEEVEAVLANTSDRAEALGLLKRWQMRETLRIATRDLLRRETVQTATAQISDVAALLVERALSVVWRQLGAAGPSDAPAGAFAVIGLGTLGGREMSYTADLELIYVFDASAEQGPARQFFQRLAQALTAALADEAPGFYRVDRRHQPGDGVCSLDEAAAHYLSHGGMPERLALIKARPIAGDRDLGRRFLDGAHAFVYGSPVDRRALLQQAGEAGDGIREVELLTQLFQLTHGGDRPSLRQPNTLAALEALLGAGLMTDAVKRELEHAYVFLRSVELRLQLADERGGEVTARHLGLGSFEGLKKQLDGYRHRIDAIYRGMLG
jgi:[glutamine synthetase] adenylyltransferase / [glutamine synthetase]-adenylyl-L-tyrosine phosphorylase